MKILLITTGGNKNPGDQFIRLGVSQMSGPFTAT